LALGPNDKHLLVYDNKNIFSGFGLNSLCVCFEKGQIENCNKKNGLKSVGENHGNELGKWKLSCSFSCFLDVFGVYVVLGGEF